MFSKRRLHDKYVSYRKLFGQNWALFKASRIGLVGLGIMIAFLIVAAAVPFMGLRDPLYWLAPESDTISVAEWWQLTVKPGSPIQSINGSVDHAIAIRIQAAANDPRADRVYAAEGHRLIAVSTQQGYMGWVPPYAFEADDTISTDVVIANFGSFLTPERTDYALFFGTRNGTVYTLRDPYDSDSIPAAGMVRSANFGSVITGVAVYSADQIFNRTLRDAFVVGTEDGHVYAFTVAVNATFNGWPFYQELWNTSLGSPVHIAGAFTPTKAIPVYSPAFYDSAVNSSRNGETVFVGTEDGNLTAFRMSDGQELWRRLLLESPTDHWTSAPVVEAAPEILPGAPTLVYAATDESRLFVFDVNSTDPNEWAPLDSWRDCPGGDPTGGSGCKVLWKGALDDGVFHTPSVFGTKIFVTSTTGWLYSVNRDPVRGRNNVIELPAVSVVWAFRDDTFRHDTTHATYFSASTYSFDRLELILAPGNYNNGTADPADDLGVVYAFNQASGALTWKKTFPRAINAMLTSWGDPLHVHEGVFFGTSRGDVYSYSTTGQYLAPLPPSWVRSSPSGNYYILGTDARGRDVFSQLLWGSRIALLVGFASAAFSIAIGLIIGLVAGFLGGRVESVLMRFTDVILVIPALPLVIIMAAVLGAGIGNIILVISIVGWPGVARIIRAEVLSLKERPFIDSARVTGASNVRIMFRHIAPNVAPLAFLYMTFAVSGAILTEAALSFIGLGDVSTISWGIMLQDVSQSKALEAWWWLLPPGMAITLISLAFFLVGRAFDEIVNPRLRKR